MKEGSKSSDEVICKFYQEIVYQGQQCYLWPAHKPEGDNFWLEQVKATEEEVFKPQI
jgi:hypothetical protein